MDPPRVGRVVALFRCMTPDVEAIVSADRAVQREIEAVKTRFAERLRAERERLDRVRSAEQSATQARIDAEAAALEREGHARADARSSARATLRDERRARAQAAVRDAVATYVAIVTGGGR
jgi:regulator of protease activity HflC (stomatin/prohibitin superfamily)